MEVLQRKTVLLKQEKSSNNLLTHKDVTKVRHVLVQQQSQAISGNDTLIAFGLFILSLPVRFKQLSWPSQVVFDEVHFGKYTSYYIKQSFFFDVHPPLAKLLIAFAAWVCGFNGDFDFTEIGKSYPTSVPFLQIRTICSLFGALVIPLAYLTIRDAGHSRIAAIITALAICFENGLIANNRLISLDSILLFFISFTMFSHVRFHKSKQFHLNWWIYLLCTGVGLGCAFSSKWVGLFTIATIGVSTAKQLWTVLGDLKITKRQYFVHLFARIFALIIIPISIYLGSFYVHFNILSNPGPGDSFLTVESQYELKGADLIDTPLPVTYDSLITIRHLETTGAYLHSHNARYPEGSGQQQISLYPYRDANNWWRITKADVSEQPANEDLLAKDNSTWLEYVRNGDVVILEHVETAPHKLHSHDVDSPVTETEYHKEVSGYGFPDHDGDANDFWVVEIDKDIENPEAGQFLQSRRSKFRLHHKNIDCDLYSDWRRLPSWGYKQQEVSCIQEGTKPKTMWMVDETLNENLPENVMHVPEHRPGFFEKLYYLHKGMIFASKSGLNDIHPYQSHPITWPVFQSGILFWISKDAQIFLLGNPLVVWSSTLAIFSFLLIFVGLQLWDKRGLVNHFNGLRTFYEESAGLFVLGWLFHYFPFFNMERQLFLHHYMPALYFAILTLGAGIDMLLCRSSRAIKWFTFAVLSASIVYTYLIYSPITYGNKWSVAECENASLIKSWNLDCARYALDGSLDNDLTELQSLSAEADLMSGIKIASTGTVPSYHYEDDGEGEDYLGENQVPVKGMSEEYPDLLQRQQSKSETQKNNQGTATEGYEGEEEDEDEEYEDEEWSGSEPTEAAPLIEYESPYIDGKEIVADEDDDEDDWPKTTLDIGSDTDKDSTNTIISSEIPITKYIV